MPQQRPDHVPHGRVISWWRAPTITIRSDHAVRINVPRFFLTRAAELCQSRSSPGIEGEKLIEEFGLNTDRAEPLSRIPDELLEAVIGLLQAYSDRRNPPPTADDIAVRLGSSAEVVSRACRKLEIRGLVVVSPGDLDSGRTYSLPVEETSGPVPEELLKSVMGLVRSYEERSNPAPTARDMAAGLGFNEREIRWACSALEADGLVRATQTSMNNYPGYMSATGMPEHTPDPERAESRNKIVFALLRSTAKVFKSELGIDVQLAGGEVRQDEVTTEDISVFLRVAGEIEGSVYYGLDRSVARELLAIAQRQKIGGINAESIHVLNTLITQVGDRASSELGAVGYDVEISPASTVQPVGMKIATHGIPQIVARLECESGPISAHVSLQEPVDEDEEADESVTA